MASTTHMTEEVIRNWFTEITNYCTKNDLGAAFDDPSRVFNLDETAVQLSPKSEKVLTKKGVKSVYNNIINCEKESLTVLVTVNKARKF